MKYEELYRQLKDIAEKLHIVYFEKNFRISGLSVKSGLCRIEGKWHFYMDKHLKVREKAEILAQALHDFQIDELYIIPAVREYIERNRP